MDNEMTLAEALDSVGRYEITPIKDVPGIWTVLRAARRWDEMPTDDDVDAAIPAFYDVSADHASIESIHRDRVRAALEAVKAWRSSRV